MAYYPSTVSPLVDPLARLPIELFHRVAGHVPLNELFRAALVSRAWRHTLLSAPLLWSMIAICPREQGDLTFVAEVLEAFLQRSRGVPITVRLFLAQDQDGDSESFEPGGPFLGAIPRLLAREMHRVRVLELVLHDWSDTPWVNVLRSPAPIMERLTLVIACGEDHAPLPGDLFANNAPRLRTVHLKDAVMPQSLVPALADVASLFYDHAGACDEQLLATICAMRSLRDLTLTTEQSFYDPHDVVPACVGLQLRRLQLWNTHDAHVVLKHFPPPEHLCFSGSIAHDMDDEPDEDPDELRTDVHLLVAAVRAKGAAQAVTIGFRAPRLAHLVDSPHKDAIYALRLDGRDVVVDLLLTELVALLHALPPPAFPGLRDLALPLALFPLFDSAQLPPLRSLSLFVAPPGDFPPLAAVIRTTAVHAVSALRIAQVVAPAVWPQWDMHLKRPAMDRMKTLPAGTFLDFVTRKFLFFDLQLVLLDGYRLSGTPQEYALLKNVISRLDVVFSGGWLPDDDCAQWQWHFPEETAFRT